MTASTIEVWTDDDPRWFGVQAPRDTYDRRYHWAQGRPGARMHAVRPGRRAVCGAHLGYGNLTAEFLHTRGAGLNRCQSCARTVAKAPYVLSDGPDND